MTSRSFLLITAAALLPLPPAFANPAEAQQRLRSAVGEVLAIADGSSSSAAFASKVRPTLERHISFDTMTSRAVGVGWRQFTQEQRKRAVQLFTSVIIRTYTEKFTPGEHPQITYQNAVSPASGRVDVPTRMVYRGSKYNVTYRMENIGGWRIADVVIEGVSLVANYRAQLGPTFSKGGAAAVISSLEQSVSRRS
ncbi:MAG TPA: organic solvent ABC transporter [Verrucomicrobiales bacterium]|nr:organic solvent ABC transporter [Verrucomicrobiales bacterium]HRJ09979.1 ABC transporter substrate-binding protein [Prosthecobacter sp.]HRK12889.1 ABC transporter substrate-binding protein [Prosthecobacter sp.]